MSSSSMPQPGPSHGWWLLGLGGFAAGMMLFFLFGYSAFYSLWCRLTGTEMSPNNLPVATAVAAHDARSLEVYFEGKAYDNLPVRFYPADPALTVRVGEDKLTSYRFKNLSDQPVRFRPIHQVSPLIAARHFSMKVCFCFKDQTIAAGESVEFPVMFSFSPELDQRVTSVTVRYSLHRIDEGEAQSESQKRIQAQLEAAGVVDGAVVTPGFESPVPPAAPSEPKR
jgi:cytochrome c oxidase assembly protein subunit 11